MLKRLLPVALLALAGLSGRQDLFAAGLPDFTASYSVTRGVLTIGTARIALTREPDGGYHYESHSWPARLAALFNKVKLHETSSGRMKGNDFRPEQYHYLRTGGSGERVAHLTFDWQSGMVVNNVAGSRWKMAVPAGTHDKLSTQLGMMTALAQGETDFSFDVADGGTLKKFHYQVLGKRVLEVPAGTFRTVRISMSSGKGRHKTLAWCAPDLNYLPVKIVRQEQGEAAYSSYLESFSESLKTANHATSHTAPGEIDE